jgi:hypothetical protein
MPEWLVARGCGCRACRPAPLTEDDPFAAVGKSLMVAINRVGWAVTYVAPDGSDLAIGYTVGLLHRGLEAEFVIVGLPATVTQDVLNDVAERALRGRLRVAPGVEDDTVFNGYPARFSVVGADRNRLSLAAWFARRSAAPGLQLVWPDRHGRFPGEPGSRLDAGTYVLA